MERHEWYKHRMLDHIEALGEYVEIMMDGAMETDLDDTDISTIYTSLIKLQSDIWKQLRS